MNHPRSRLDLALCVPNGGLFVELGVARGAFAGQLVATNSAMRYLGIDRWSDHHNEDEKQLAISRLKNSSSRLIHSTFEDAAATVPDESCDVVYVDGYAHTGQENGKTLEIWWGKVKRGGMLAGHDYHSDWEHTIKAVNRFAGMRGLEIHIIPEVPYPSWFLKKPTEPTRLINGTCVLVGNGPTLLGSGLGEAIDAHDEIVRFNNYQTLGFEADCGKRTTIWSCYGENAKRTNLEKPGKVLYSHGSIGGVSYQPKEMWRIPLSFYNEMKDRLRSASSEADKTKLLPSAGLLVAHWLIEVLGVPQLSLAGFSHFSPHGGQHHYWDRTIYSRALEHDGTAERLLFQELRSRGALIPI